MKRLLLAAIAALALVSNAQAMTFAQLALGGPYELVLIVTNKTDHNSICQITLKSGNAQTWPSKISMNGGTLMNLGALNLMMGARTTSKTVFAGEAEVRTGYLEINGIDGYSITDFAVNYFYVYRDGKTVIDSTGVPASDSSNRFIVPVERGEACDTGFAWAPYVDPSVPASFDVTFALYDNRGQLFASVSKRFEGHTATFFSQIFQNLPASFVGHLRLEAQHRFYFVALRMDSPPGGPQFTAIEGQTTW